MNQEGVGRILTQVFCPPFYSITDKNNNTVLRVGQHLINPLHMHYLM